MLYPNQLPGQRLGEKVVCIVRHHWFAFARVIIGFFLLGGLFAAVGWMVIRIMPQYLDHPMFGPLMILAAHSVVLLLWIFLANAFIEAYLDVWIVTNERVIDIEQHGLFNRTISELHLNRIQDISTTVTGFTATTFGFGSMTVTTAEAHERFFFADMPDPERMKDLIFKLAQGRATSNQ